MKRRWRWQFRLWQGAVGVTAICVALAWGVSLRQRSERQARAMLAVQMVGGTADAKVLSPLREWIAGGPVDRELTVRFSGMSSHTPGLRWGPYGPGGTPVKLHDWGPERFAEVGRALGELSGVTHLVFDGTRLRGHAATLVPSSPKLRTLSLAQTGVWCHDLAVLARTPNLTALSLRRTSTADEGLRHVSRLGWLEWLDLSSTDVSDAGMPEVARLTGLTTLRLGNTRLSDAGLRRLAGLRGLEEFDVGMTLVSEESLPLLIGMQVGRRLVVPAEWSNEGVEALQRSSPATCQVSASPYRLADHAGAKALRD